ncbi:MAG: CaiB/BaiF CoA transferase family protein [Polaromonas sp.]
MGVLSGIKVLEIAAIGPVPWCGMLLADMGASVIRVDRPGPAAPADSDAMKRGRVSVQLDLKVATGTHVALDLVAKADVVMEGMRPGAMERLGLGPDVCLARNPALVFARMTGWGQSGPLSSRAGHDINYIALTGALHAIGREEKPVPPLNLVGDYGGGGTFLAIGLLAALLEAKRSGQGRAVDVAMIDGAASLMTLPHARLGLGQWLDARGQNMLDGGAPWYDVYKARDGKFMAVGAIEPQFYAELLHGLGLAPDDLPPRSDKAGWPVIRARLEKIFLTRTRDEWAALFENTDACVSPVLSLTEAPLHPHNVAREIFQPWNGHAVPGPAPRFEGYETGMATESIVMNKDEALAYWSNGPGTPAGPV